jgi:hypothetical protein
VGIAAGLKLQVEQPRNRFMDAEDLVGLGTDGGEIRIDDVHPAGRGQPELGKPVERIGLDQLFECRVEWLGHR